jgi:hypothetical protein
VSTLNLQNNWLQYKEKPLAYGHITPNNDENKFTIYDLHIPLYYKLPKFVKSKLKLLSKKIIC